MPHDVGDVTGAYRPRVGPLTVLRFGLGVGYVFLGVLITREGEHPRMAWTWCGFALMWFLTGLLYRRPRTIVDQDGIRVRTVRRWRHLPWDQINFTTSAPSEHFRPTHLTIRTVDGREVATQIPAVHWSALKAYGSSRKAAQ